MHPDDTINPFITFVNVRLMVGLLVRSNGSENRKRDSLITCTWKIPTTYVPCIACVCLQKKGFANVSITAAQLAVGRVVLVKVGSAVPPACCLVETIGTSLVVERS